MTFKCQEMIILLRGWKKSSSFHVIFPPKSQSVEICPREEKSGLLKLIGQKKLAEMLNSQVHQLKKNTFRALQNRFSIFQLISIS